MRCLLKTCLVYNNIIIIHAHTVNDQSHRIDVRIDNEPTGPPKTDLDQGTLFIVWCADIVFN